ncbi:MAG: hypothetical protein ACN6QE_00005, partial [Pseudomonas putida]
CCAPGPTDAYARPPESLKIKSQIKIKIKSQIKIKIKIKIKSSVQRSGRPLLLGASSDQAPWHFLNFFSLPHGQGSLRPTSFRALRTGS